MINCLLQLIYTYFVVLTCNYRNTSQNCLFFYTSSKENANKSIDEWLEVETNKLFQILQLYDMKRITSC